jgi:heptosyltransferase I
MPDHAPTARILIVRPSALGDVCRSVPVLVSLKRAFSDAQVDWLVQDSFADAIRHHPDLGSAVLFPRAKFRKFWQGGHWREIAGFLGQLRSAQYDLVLDCQGLARSGFIARYTGAPERVGYANAGEFGWLGVNRRVEAPEHMHTVDRMLALAESVGAAPVADMRLYTSPEDRAFVTNTCGLLPGSYAVAAPTTRWPGKLWPLARHIELAKRLLSDPVLGLSKVVVTGSQGEREQCAELLALSESEPRVVDMVGKTSVGQMMALIESSGLVIGCDSAAIHMAVGFDRPLAALYGPTRVERVGPYRRGHHVVQRLMPDDHLDHKDDAAGQSLMQRIQVEDVLEVVYEQARSRKRAVTTKQSSPTPAV